MPLNLITPLTVEETVMTKDVAVDVVRIKSIKIMPDSEQIIINYQIGYMDGENEVLSEEKRHVISNTLENQAYNTFCASNLQLVTDVKNVSYNEIATLLGVTGTVS